MAIINVNNPGDVVLDQAPEPLPAPILPVTDNVPGMPNLMSTIPAGAQAIAANTPPPVAAAPPPPPVPAVQAQPRFTKVDPAAPIQLDPAPAQAPVSTNSGLQKLPPNAQIKLDPLPKSDESYLQATGDALIRGAVQGGTDVAHAASPYKDRPTTKGPGDAVDQVINGPIWRGDLKDTIGGMAVKTAHNIGANAPSFGLGIAGAIGGGAAGGPIGATAGGAAGFGAGSALQEIAPAYERAREDGLTHDQAVDRAIHETLVAGGFGVIAGLAPEVKFFGKSWQMSGVGADGIAEMVKQARKPISEALAQVFGVQPAVGAVQQKVDATIENKPLTAADLASGYVNNAVTGGVLSGLHGVKDMVLPEKQQINPTATAPGSGSAKPQPPIYDADVVVPPKKISGPDAGGQPETPNGDGSPTKPAPGGVQVEVPLTRDDLANAIKNKTPLPQKKIITLPDVHIDPELQAQGFTVGNKVQQVTDDGEVHEGTIASARAGDDGTEVTMLDDHGNLRTLFSTDGPITAAKVPPAASQPAAPVSAPPAPTSAATAPAAPPARAEDLYGQMDLPALKNSLDFVNNHGKVNGWNKSSSATKRAITEQLNARFPEWDVPGRVDVANAAAEVAAAPTDAQKEAGNYQKGHVSIQGLPVTLETVKGQIRSGVGPDGKPWEVPMPAHYGYIKRTTGADDEHVDVYVGNNPSAKDVYVVDQIDHEANKFDEHKAMIGFSSLDEALKTYQQAFSDGHGAARMGGVSTMSVQEFKQWLRKPGARRSPLAFTGGIESAKAPAPAPERFVPQGDKMASDFIGSFYGTLSGEEKAEAIGMVIRVRDTSKEDPKNVDKIAWTIVEALQTASKLKDLGADSEIGKMGTRAINLANRYSHLLYKDSKNPKVTETFKKAVDVLYAEKEKADAFIKSKSAPEGQVALKVNQTPESKSAETASDKNQAVAASSEVDKSTEKPTEATNGEEFEKWFKGSKIVDENGNPLVVYHGTGHEFDKFEPQNLLGVQKGMFFSANKNYANFYSYTGGDKPNIKSVYLNIKNPKYFEQGVFDKIKISLFGEKERKRIRRDGARSSAVVTLEKMEALRRRGYDGIINNHSNEIIAFSPEQVRIISTENLYTPAEDNNGAVRQGEVQAGIPDRVGGAEATPITKDDEGQNAGVAPQGEGGGSGTGVSTRGSVPDEGTQHGSGAGAESGVGNSATLNDAVPESINKPEPAKEKIEDFGQKLVGAKKDIWKEYKDAFSEDLPTDPNEITMAKHFPEPDYANLIENGVSIQDLATIKAMRDTIPAKPRKSWKLKDWAGKVTALREFAADILNGKTDSDKVIAGMKGFSSGLNSLAGQIELYKELGYPAFTKADGWKIGHGSYSMYAGQKFDPPKSMWSLAKGSSFGTAHETRADAVNTLREKLMAEIEAGPQAKKTTLDLFSDRRTGKYFIGKKLAAGKVIRLKEGFDSAKEARTYLRDNEAALISDLEKRKEVPSERRNTNEPRVGKDYRGTEDATPEKFAGEFGFRGVQFGNYVEQGKRAVDLNDAYDGLKDMASIVGIPSRAISLDGTLGLAFGARGSGGKRAAKAHYEPDNIVINLTKSSGAGSLGHEWFHALDNNFGKRSGDSFITENPRYTPEVRKEVTDAFKGVVDAISKTGLRQRSKQLDMTRSKDYWSTTIEMGARSFEAYLIHRAAAKGEANDYLANIVGHDAWKALYADDKNTESYPYPTDEEMEKHIAPAFDKLFSTLKTEETSNGNVTMYSLGNKAADRLQSTLLKTADAMRQGKGTGDQILGYLRKQSGVKEEEIAWTGLDDFLKGKTGVTKEDVVNYLNENQVRVEEHTLESGKGFTVINGDGFEEGHWHTRAEAEKHVKELENDGYSGVKIEEDSGRGDVNNTKYSDRVLPGGENYREVLLTLPQKDSVTKEKVEVPQGWGDTEGGNIGERKIGDNGNDFRSSHFDQPNVVAHIRLNDRTDADGKKVLFVEEIQSDWHQKGRKVGYKGDKKVFGVFSAEDGFRLAEFDTKAEAEEWKKEHEYKKAEIREVDEHRSVPDAPFKKSWQEMAFRRVAQMAAQGGYDRIAWTTGEQQNDRYDLSKSIERIEYNDKTHHLMAFEKGGDIKGRPDINETVIPENLPDHIGKEAAEKIMQQTPGDSGQGLSTRGYRVLNNQDLKIGGEGMKGFYDKIIPQYAAKFGKKFGATVGDTSIETGIPESAGKFVVENEDGEIVGTYLHEKDAEKLVDFLADRGESAKVKTGSSSLTDVHSMDITPAMRESADAGFELFKQKDANLPATQETVRAGDIQAAINEQMKKQGYTDANVKLFSGPEETGIAGMDAGAEGVYHNGIIHISMDAADPLKVLDHETIHELKAAGAFTPAEWKTLEAKAGEWRKKYKIDENYAEHDLSDRQLNEEGIAHAFQDHDVQGPIRRIINRVLNFFKAIRDFLRGKGFNFKSAEDIFNSVKSGEVSKRKSARHGREEIRNRQAARAGAPDESFPKYDLGKAKGPSLDEAGEALSRVRGLDRTLLSDIKRVSSAVLHPHQIATLYKEFTPVYRSIVERFKQREVLIHQLSKNIDLYNKLDQKGKNNVDAALELGRLNGETFKPEDDGTITVKNEGLENTIKSKDGDTVKLSPVEAKAYAGVRTMLDTALDKYKDTILEDAGLLEKGINTVQDVEKLRAEAVKSGDVDQVRNLKSVLQKLHDVVDAKKKGYVPFKRWGDVGISVKNSDGDTVHFEKVEISNRDRKKGYIGESKAVQEAVERLTKKFPSDEYEINAFEMSKFDQVAANVDLRNLDILAASSEMEPSEYERLREMLEKELQKKGFRSHFFKAKDVPGYSGDFERAINDYVVTISSYIARRLNNSKIETALAGVAESGKSKLHDYAKNYVDYVNNPREELSTIRMVGFFWYLAGNISSGVVNLTQPLIMTGPWLKGSFKNIDIGKTMTKAYADVLKLVDLKNAGTEVFNFDKAPADVRDALIKAYNEGDFLSLTTNDAMAISSTSQSLRGLDKTRRTVMDALGMTFSVPEKINRIVTFVSAYRLAMQPGAQDKIRNFVNKDELGRAMLAGQKTPEDFAFAYAELATVSTQFRIGNLNRPQVARGFGSLVFQFQSFTMQCLELMYKMAKVNGGHNKMALAAIILSVIALAGTKGPPFEDNAKNLIEALFKFATKRDLDIDTDIREAIIKHTGSPTLAEAIIKGVPAALLNIDLSGRLGFGNIAPDPSKISLGPWMDILYHNPQQSAKDMSEGRYLQALADVAPAFIKNPLTAYMWGSDGVRTQKGIKVIDSSKVSDVDVTLKALGFTSADISTKRDQVYATERANSAVTDLKTSYYNHLAQDVADRLRFYKAGNKTAGDQATAKIQATMSEIRRYNQTVPAYQMVKIDPNALKAKIMQEMIGADGKKSSKFDALRDQQLKQIYQRNN